jgi:hypothetical protein
MDTAIWICNITTLVLVAASMIVDKKLKNRAVAEIVELGLSGMAFGVVVGNLIHIFLR